MKKSGKTVSYAAPAKLAYEVPLYIEEFDCGRGGCLADIDEVQDCTGDFLEDTKDVVEAAAPAAVAEEAEDEPTLLERALSYAHGLKFAACTHREPASHSRAHLAGHEKHYVNPQYSRARGPGGISQVQDVATDYGSPYGGYTGYGSYGLGYGGYGGASYGKGYPSQQIYEQQGQHQPGYGPRPVWTAPAYGYGYGY